MSGLFAYPKQAEFDRTLPKNKIYEHSGANTRLKDLFVEQVEKIVWRYKLAPETINLAAKPGVPEIQVFAIQLKMSELHRDVLRCIDGAVQFPIIFELTHGQGAEARSQVAAAYKRPSETDPASWVCSDYFESAWTPATTARAPLPLALDLAGLYDQLLLALIPLGKRESEPLAALVKRAELAAAKRHEIQRVQARLAKEKQFNRKVGLNAQLRELKTELESLTA
jgi:hypothetical protein